MVRTLKRLHSFQTKIVGITESNQDGTSRQELIRQSRKGEPLLLVRQPDNPDDENTIAVCRQSGEQIGTLTRYVAEDLAPRIDAGDIIDADLKNFTGRRSEPRGVMIEITFYTEVDRIAWGQLLARGGGLLWGAVRVVDAGFGKIAGGNQTVHWALRLSAVAVVLLGGAF